MPVVSASQPAGFGNVLVGTTSAAVSDMVTVSGQAANTTLTVSAGAAPFSGPGLNQTISGTSRTSATVSYTFSPASTGSFSQNLTATDTSPGSNSVTLTLTGTGVVPVELVSNPTIYARIGGGSGSGVVTVSNTGNGNLSGLGSVSNLNGSVSSSVLGSGFTASAGNPSSFSLADGSSSTLGFTYTPVSRTPVTSTVRIAFSNGNAAGNNLSQSVAATVTGQGVGPTYASALTNQGSTKGSVADTPTPVALGVAGAASSTISFGSVGYKASQTLYLWLQNTTTDANGGNASLTNLTIDRYAISGPNASAFSIASLSPGSVIAEGSTLMVPIVVTGTTGIGALNSTLTIFTDELTGLGGAGDTFTYALVGFSVPEPASLGVLGTGIAGLGWLRRRRQAVG